jgi:hypothetical protein
MICTGEQHARKHLAGQFSHFAPLSVRMCMHAYSVM